MSSRRIRQHVNPLGLRFQIARAVPVEVPAQLGPAARVEVELGCADAQFSFELARNRPDLFVVGLEIREALVLDNRRLAERSGLANLAFGYANVNVDLERVFGPESVDRFHLLFPDPWFKHRHRKRRVLGPRFVAGVRRQLRPGGELHIASDVYALVLEAMAELEAEAAYGLGFRNLAGPWSFWRDNPFPASSRREDTTLARGQRVWRIRYGVPLAGGEAPQPPDSSPPTAGKGKASSRAEQRS